jgi:pimeloyl-ACP methyl ester carboxylesterase
MKKQRIGEMCNGVSKQIGDQYAVPGLLVSDHTVTVPLDYSGVLKGTINVFYRIVSSRNKQSESSSMPFLLYLQGGPGSESPRPTDCGGWIRGAVNYFRVVLMDQRGTGLSSAITCDNLGETTDDVGDQAKYLMCFRADSIVRDSEVIRTCLARQQANGQEVRWSLLGQSFGGFCCTTYLSMYPEGLLEVMITGGIPPKIDLPCAADEVYRRLFRRVLTQNAKFYSRFPMAEERARRIVLYLADQRNGHIVTPGQNILSPRSFQLLGLTTLGFAGGFERLHYMLEGAFDQSTSLGTPSLSQRFLKDFDCMSWDTNPLYALLHESIYCQGAASGWAAQRVREGEFRDEFDAVGSAKAGRPVMFTGEMVFPWMFEELRELSKVRAVADQIAKESSWPVMYDKAKLKSNTVPVAAALYYEDMFVDFDLAQETSKHITGLRQYVTNEWLHDGIRENGTALFEKLMNLCRNGVLLR